MKVIVKVVTLETKNTKNNNNKNKNNKNNNNKRIRKVNATYSSNKNKNKNNNNNNNNNSNKPYKIVNGKAVQIWDGVTTTVFAFCNDRAIFEEYLCKVNVRAKLNNGQIIVGNEGGHLGCFQGLLHISGFMRSLFGYKDFYEIT